MRLIINADDFGITKKVNEGILHGMENGVITSTTIMMNMPGTEDAIEKIKEIGLTNVGIHLNLTVGKPICDDVNSLVDEEGIFYYRDKIGEKATSEDARKEMKAQIEKYRSYGIEPDHLDHHHDIYNHSHLMQVLYELALEYKLPLRTKNGEKKEKAKALGIKTPDVFLSHYYNDNVSVDTLKEIVEQYKDEDITVESLTHSGYVDDELMNISSYNTMREIELQTLIKAKEQGIFEIVDMISFGEL